jgi:limonene-1,2-epoxide hydrolase
VTAFLAALEDLDIDRALTYADPGIVYQNVPLPPARGIKAFERQMRTMARYGTGFEARVHNIAANGDTVLTERTDALVIGSWRAEFWVCGTFEVHEGKITLWRDYFDWPTVIAAGAKGLVRSALTALGGASQRSSNVKS